MSWYPYHASMGYEGVDCGDICWRGDDGGRNTECRLVIKDEDMARQIIKDLAEAIDEGRYE